MLKTVIRILTFILIGLVLGFVQPILLMCLGFILARSELLFQLGMLLGMFPTIIMGLATGFYSKNRIESFISGCISSTVFLIIFIKFFIGLIFSFNYGVIGFMCGAILSQIGFTLRINKNQQFFPNFFKLFKISILILIIVGIFHYVFFGIFKMSIWSFFSKYSCEIRGGNYDNFEKNPFFDTGVCYEAGKYIPGQLQPF